MSLIATIHVECDQPSCSEQVLGAVGVHRDAALRGEARQVARDRGWARRRVGDRMVDLCPAHAELGATPAGAVRPSQPHITVTHSPTPDQFSTGYAAGLQAGYDAGRRHR